MFVSKLAKHSPAAFRMAGSLYACEKHSLSIKHICIAVNAPFMRNRIRNRHQMSTTFIHMTMREKYQERKPQ